MRRRALSVPQVAQRMYIVRANQFVIKALAPRMIISTSKLRASSFKGTVRMYRIFGLRSLVFGLRFRSRVFDSKSLPVGRLKPDGSMKTEGRRSKTDLQLLIPPDADLVISESLTSETQDRRPKIEDLRASLRRPAFQSLLILKAALVAALESFVGT